MASCTEIMLYRATLHALALLTTFYRKNAAETNRNRKLIELNLDFR